MALLLAIVIVGTVGTAVLVVMAQTSISGVVNSTEHLSAMQTRSGIFGCLDEALIHLQANPNYAVTSLTTGTATCTVLIQNGGGNGRTLTLTLTTQGLTRRLVVSLTVSPVIVTQVLEQ